MTDAFTQDYTAAAPAWHFQPRGSTKMFPVTVSNGYNSSGLKCTICVSVIITDTLKANVQVNGVFQLGETLKATYTLVNNSLVGLTAVNFLEVVHAGGTSPVTPPANSVLADGESVSFEADHTVTQQNIDDEFVLFSFKGEGVRDDDSQTIESEVASKSVMAPVTP